MLGIWVCIWAGPTVSNLDIVFQYFSDNFSESPGGLGRQIRTGSMILFVFLHSSRSKYPDSNSRREIGPDNNDRNGAYANASYQRTVFSANPHIYLVVNTEETRPVDKHLAAPVNLPPSAKSSTALILIVPTTAIYLRPAPYRSPTSYLPTLLSL